MSIEKWWKNNGQKIIILGIIFLVGVIGFKLGELQSQNNIPMEILLRNLPANPNQEKAQIILESLKRQGIDLESEKNNFLLNNKECRFVASKKSKKYHTANCRYGKSIKFSNRICFKTQEEAKKKGYIPAKGCLGK